MGVSGDDPRRTRRGPTLNTSELTVLFRIISRRDWDRLQGWHTACPGSRIEHLMFGLYALHVPAGVRGGGAA